MAFPIIASHPNLALAVALVLLSAATPVLAGTPSAAESLRGASATPTKGAPMTVAEQLAASTAEAAAATASEQLAASVEAKAEAVAPLAAEPPATSQASVEGEATPASEPIVAEGLAHAKELEVATQEQAPPAVAATLAEGLAGAVAEDEKKEDSSRKGILGLVGIATSNRKAAADAVKASKPRVNSLMQRLSSTFGFSGGKSDYAEADDLDAPSEMPPGLLARMSGKSARVMASEASVANALMDEVDQMGSKKEAVSLLQLGASRASKEGGARGGAAGDDVICDLKGCRPKPKARKHDEL